jgi:hypothetical protein
MICIYVKKMKEDKIYLLKINILLFSLLDKWHEEYMIIETYKMKKKMKKLFVSNKMKKEI